MIERCFEGHDENWLSKVRITGALLPNVLAINIVLDIIGKKRRYSKRISQVIDRNFMILFKTVESWSKIRRMGGKKAIFLDSWDGLANMSDVCLGQFD